MNTLTFPGVVGSIEVYMDVMRAICGETEGKSMIDLCCAFAPNTPKLGFSKRRYIDIIDRKLDHPEEQEFFSQADVLNLVPMPPELVTITNLYDVAICSDGIEHLTETQGRILVSTMLAISHKQILFTPLDDLFGMAKEGDNDPEAHRSLWHPDMLPGFNHIVFPDYHKVWNGGAFFMFGPGTDKELERVIKNLQTKHWYNGIHE
jgi:hypothetical protein